jgi:hypothetical protein
MVDNVLADSMVHVVSSSTSIQINSEKKTFDAPMKSQIYFSA